MIDVDCYCTQSRRLSRSLTEAYDRALRATGLTAAQFSLLRTMSRVDTPTSVRSPEQPDWTEPRCAGISLSCNEMAGSPSHPGTMPERVS